MTMFFARPWLLVLLLLPLWFLLRGRRRARVPIGDGALPAAAARRA
jgi:hypothetical protein